MTDHEKPKYTHKSTVLHHDGTKSVETRTDKGARINRVMEHLTSRHVDLDVKPVSLLERGLKSKDHEPGDDSGPKL